MFNTPNTTEEKVDTQQITINKKNIDALHSALKDEIKQRESLASILRTKDTEIAQLREEINQMRALFATFANRR